MQIFLNRWFTTAGIVLSCQIGVAQGPVRQPAAGQGLMGQQAAGESLMGQPAATRMIDQDPVVSKMDWWRQARFGMFIHWGVYAVPAGVYHGRAYDGLGEWLMQDAHIPRAEYSGFARQFDPKGYDPEQWVLLARAAGMKYIVITAKHHDGFALFGSKASSWNVVDASPYGKDLLAPLVAACRKYGMKIGFYYSQANDWYNPGGAAANGHWDPGQTTRSMDEYIEKVAVPQVRELLTRYGDVAELWWDVPSDMTPARAARLKELLSLQPNVIINDRLGGDVPGDITTPEQYVPATGIPGRDWETCMTINDTWGFKVNDTNWKSTATLVRNLADIASKGGNYLLNVGPDADGRLPKAITERLQSVGKWMDKYGESIYGTSASPFAYLPWGRCTQRSDVEGTTLYFQIGDWPKDGRLFVPGLSNTVLSAVVMGSEKKLGVVAAEDGIVFQVPESPADSLLSVIKVRVKGRVTVKAYVVSPAASGSFELLPQEATIDNPGLKPEEYARVEGGEEANIGWWTNAASSVSWKIRVPVAGSYMLWGKLSTAGDECRFVLEVGDRKVFGRLDDTGGYDQYREVELGRIDIGEPGVYTVRLSADGEDWQPMNVRSVKLRK